jgi:hypothetical protein
MKSPQKRLTLGYPLDLLLNRICRYEKYERYINNEFLNLKTSPDLPGSIVLPNTENPGTGNIIIRGKPGTAKSTLALQFAVAAAQIGNNCISFYITLEEKPENLYFKSKLFGWDLNCSVFNQLCGIEDSASVDDYTEYLKRAMTQNPNNCRFQNFKKNDHDACKKHDSNRIINPNVYISTFSPRNLFKSDSNESNLFWDRYIQLERLLAASNAYNNSKTDDQPLISFVCIDSINVFGDNLLSRADLFRIFDLFKRYEIIGIIIVEEDEKYIFQNKDLLHGETIEYLGDVIISLTSEEDQNYSLRYFEITKSRYQHQIYGKHPFKIAESILTLEEQEEFLKGYNSIELNLSDRGDLWEIDSNSETDTPFDSNLESFSVKIDNIKLFPVNRILTRIEECKFQFTLNDKILSIGRKNEKELAKQEKLETIILKFIKKDNKYRIGGIEEVLVEDIIETKSLIIYLNLKPVYAVKIFPSLHYIVFGSDLPKKTVANPNKIDELFFENNISTYLSASFETPGLILLEGPYATFKTTMAKDFLLRGLVKQVNDNRVNHSILVRFADESSITHEIKFRLSKSFCDTYSISNYKDKIYLFEHFKEDYFNENSKRIIKTFRINYVLREKDVKECHLEGLYTEVLFKSGQILPEEFIQVLLEIFNTNNKDDTQTSIVFDEIGRIGTSYPLLLKSKSSGELFLTAITHILRNYQATVILTGTTGEFGKADLVIDEARTLADTVLSTRNVNIFGDSYILLRGEGMITRRSGDDVSEKVPGVILPLTNENGNLSAYEVDKFYLDGLVGFETNNIYRPGIAIYMFEENDIIHHTYNNNLKHMLEVAFTTNKLTLKKEDSRGRDVGIIPFSGANSPSYHEALDIAQGNPLDKTILFTIDEFYRAKDHKEFYASFLGFDFDTIKKEFEIDEAYSEAFLQTIDGKKIYSFPYYDNVLFLAVNKERIEEEINKKGTNDFNEDDFYNGFKKWSDILKLVNELNIDTDPIDLCLLTRETMSCIMLDLLLNCSKNYNKTDDDTIELKAVIANVDESELLTELEALSKLFSKSGRVKKEFTENSKNRENPMYNGMARNQLLPDSLIYVCWYSEIRELIIREPHLSNKLEVFQLPGKGFRGDWHIGILKGSVSASLGLKVVKKLCSKNEDFKRFTYGVGLPTKTRFGKKNNFLAWPNSNIDINKHKEFNSTGIIETQLSLIYEIHKQAHERAKINGYLNYKDLLVSLFQELIMIEAFPNANSIKSTIIERLKPLYDILS